LRFVAKLDTSAPDLDERVEDGKKSFAGVELPGRTLGIVGLGAIGSLVADTAIRLGMKVIGFDPEITVDAAWRLPSTVRKAHSIEELLRQAEFVTLHVPLLDVTRNLIDARRLSLMRPDASLLNFARAAIVDEEAVVCGAARPPVEVLPVRFPERPLRRRAGSRRPSPPRRVHRGSGAELRDHGRRSAPRIPRATVRSPTRSTSRASRCRASRRGAWRSPTQNVPNMLGQISTAMAHAGLNIHNMVNKSRGGDRVYARRRRHAGRRRAGRSAGLGSRRRVVGARDSAVQDD
jgi:D-3-phosphoglycerate dehydrogenase